MMVDSSAGAPLPPPTEPAVASLRAWSSVAILLVLALVSLLDRQLIALLVDPIKADLGLSDTQIGLLQGFAFTLFYITAALPIGWAVDRYPRRVVCWAGVTVWSLGAAACGLAGQFWQLFAARLVVGAGEASLTPASVSLISDLFPREKVGLAMGIFVSSISLGSGAALVLGGLIVDLLAGHGPTVLPLLGAIAPWQAVFLVTGLPGLVIALLAFMIADPRGSRPAIRAAGHATDMPDQSLRAYLAANTRLVVLVLAGFSFAAVNFYAVASWTPAFLGRSFGMKIGTIGRVWGLVVAGSGAFGAIAGGMAIDRASRRGVGDSALAVPVGAALVAWPVLTVAYRLPDPRWVMAALGLGMLLIAVVGAGSLSIWQRIAPAHVRGRMSAIFGLASTGSGATLGPLIPALVTDRVFANPKMIGWSLAIVLGAVSPLVVLALAGARRELARKG